MAVRGPHHCDVDSDVVEPDDTVHPAPLDWRLTLQLHTKFGKERSSSLKVLDNDADVVHPLNRHIPEHRSRMSGYAGERWRRKLVDFNVIGLSGLSSSQIRPIRRSLVSSKTLRLAMRA